MDQSEFIIAMTALVLGGGIVITLITSVAKHLARRSDPGSLGSGALSQIDERLSRMEQAIDSIAIEVERVSEGQRFTARLLADRPADRIADRIG